MEIEKGVLYVVGTPIGNLGDLSPRAKDTLSGVDFIAAEDTRVTMKLLQRFDIHKPMISYFEHNKQEHGKVILQRVLAGESCALVSDAGMPAISDPGETLVAQCVAAGVTVYAVPGPTALTAALAISGMPTGRFTFEGFLSINKNNRHAHLLSLCDETRTMVFYEAPHKLQKTLRDMKRVLGDRKITLARELTKIHEEVIRTTFTEAIRLAKEKEPKGEYVLIIEGAAPKAEKEITFEEAVLLARGLMEKGFSASEAASRAAKSGDFKKGEIYKEMMTE